MDRTHEVLRDASAQDAARCAQIYAYYVKHTPITFEVDAPSAEQMAERIAAAQRLHCWLVLEENAQVIGYAYATAYSVRAAYDWSCETSVYLDPEYVGKGAGRRLYTALFDRLVQRGYRQAIASITVPNERSVRLHESFGFRTIGTFQDIGWKLDAWHDVVRMQKALGEDAIAPKAIV